MFWKRLVLYLTVISSVLSAEDTISNDTLDLESSAMEVNTDEVVTEPKDLVFDTNFTTHNPSESTFFDYLTTVSEYNSKLQVNLPPVKTKCERRWVRKEFRDLTKAEQTKYINAINHLYNTPSKRRPGYTLYEEFAMIHVENADQAHSSAQFLPWHRAFIAEFEQVLMQIDPTLTLPYWDWTVDAYFPEKSEVLKIFGSSRVNGDRSAACITEGNFKDYKLTFPYPHCISRGADLERPNPSRWMNSKELSLMVATTTSYPKFAFQFEVDSHSLVHFYLAGSDDDDQFNIGDMYYMHSPNDPLFFLHHGFVDKTFHEWQQTFDKNRTRYSGRSRSGIKVYGSDIMIPWDYDVTTVLDINNLCYSYQPPINIRKPEFLAKYTEDNKNLNINLNVQNEASTTANLDERHIDISRQRTKYGKATSGGSISPNRSTSASPLDDHENIPKRSNFAFNCDYFKKRGNKNFFNSSPSTTDLLPKNLTSSKVFLKVSEKKMDIYKEEKKLPYITPSDKYLKRMGIDKQKFLEARKRTESIGKAVKEFANLGVDIPNIEQICK